MHNRHIFGRARVCQTGDSLCLLFPYFTLIYIQLYLFLFTKSIYLYSLFLFIIL
jgi:hypothetical protein